MKVLLINPTFTGIEFNAGSASIPIGIAYVGSYLHSNGIEVKIIDCLTNPNHLEEIKKELPSCTWVGMSVMTTQVPHALALCNTVRSINPGIPIVWGGPHPTLFPAQTVVDSRVDIIVRDEGEETSVQLTRELNNEKKDLSSIAGISYKQKDGLIMHTPRRKAVNMETLPFINYDLMDQDVLSRLTVFPSHTSRGCAHRCSFCINPLTGCGWRGMSARRVLDELKSVTARFPNRKIRFWDENFFNSAERAREIVKGIIDEKIPVRWESTVRGDYFTKMLDDDFLRQIKESGCYKLCLGAESGSPRVLRILKKDVTAEQLVLSAKKTREFGISPEYSFMIGLPNEKKEDMLLTIDLIKNIYKANPTAELLGPQPFRPYPGSPLDRECEAYGWQAPKTLQQWSDLIYTEWSGVSTKTFPWVEEPDFVEALWPYLNFALTPRDRLLKGGLRASKVLKLVFRFAARVRWHLKYFDHPIEYKIGRRYLESRQKEMKTCPFDPNGQVIQPTVCVA